MISWISFSLYFNAIFRIYIYILFIVISTKTSDNLKQRVVIIIDFVVIYTKVFKIRYVFFFARIRFGLKKILKFPQLTWSLFSDNKLRLLTSLRFVLIFISLYTQCLHTFVYCCCASLSLSPDDFEYSQILHSLSNDVSIKRRRRRSFRFPLLRSS